MRTISITILVALCITGNAEQFSSTNAAFQAKLQSLPVPKFQSVPESWQSTTTGYTNESRQDVRDMWKAVDSWPKGEMTNGLFCMVQMLLRTTCCAYVANTTTNNVLGYLRLPFEAMSEIDLFDSQGKPMAKTATGKRFSYWTQEQIKDYLQRVNPTSLRRKGYLVIHGLFYDQISNDFSIPQAFQVNQPGEYTFHLSVRLTKGEQDKSGQFLTSQLPEVVAKVQIRSEDIPLENLPPNAQTNSPTK